MEPSTSETTFTQMAHAPWLTTAALVCMVLAAAILLWFLIRRPRLITATKIMLLLSLGALPIGAAFTGNVASFTYTTTRPFCGSCHVMTPFTSDAADPNSNTLPARHSRNQEFGEHSCYVCHANYGMFGTLLTKANGMRHVYEYYTHYRSLTIEEALPRIEIYTPFTDTTCTRCHSMTVPTWRDHPDHRGLEQALRQNQVSCLSEGCHGPAHPFARQAGARR